MESVDVVISERQMLREAEVVRGGARIRAKADPDRCRVISRGHHMLMRQPHK